MSTRDVLFTGAFAFLAIAATVSVPDFRINTYSIALAAVAVVCLMAAVGIGVREFRTESSSESSRTGIFQGLGLSRVRPLALNLEVVAGSSGGLSLRVTSHEPLALRNAKVVVTNLLWWSQKDAVYVEQPETHEAGPFRWLELGTVFLSYGQSTEVGFLDDVTDCSTVVHAEAPEYVPDYHRESISIRPGIWRMFCTITVGQQQFEGSVCFIKKGSYSGHSEPIVCPVEGTPVANWPHVGWSIDPSITVPPRDG